MLFKTKAVIYPFSEALKNRSRHISITEEPLKSQEEGFKATFGIAIVLSVLFDKWSEMTTSY